MGSEITAHASRPEPSIALQVSLILPPKTKPFTYTPTRTLDTHLRPAEALHQRVDQPPVLVISHAPPIVDLGEQEAQDLEGDLRI